MNRTYFLKMTLLLCCLLGLYMKPYAQVAEKALASVVYDFVHVTDTTQRANPRKESMVLYLGQHGSVYKSQTLALKLEEMKKKAANDFSGKAVRNQLSFHSPNISSEELYLFPEEYKLFIGDKIGPTSYIVSEPFPKIDWQILQVTKEIGGYHCQQAKGNFGGRTYIAWFTTELPFPYGPWKLHGLPGLILEAADSKQEVCFHYAGFDKLANTHIDIILPDQAITTTSKDFERAKVAFEKNPMAGLRNSLPANAKMKLVMKDESGRELSPDEITALRATKEKNGKNQINNPLELDKK